MDSILKKITSVQIHVYLVVIIFVLLVVFGFICIKYKSAIESMTDVTGFISGDKCLTDNIDTNGVNADSADIKTVYVDGDPSSDSFYIPTPFMAEGSIS